MKGKISHSKRGAARQALRELVERIDRALPRDGCIEPQPGVFFHRISAPGEAVHAVSEPSFCVIAQGSKVCCVGADVFRYDPANYLISVLEVPITGEVVKATPRQPYLSFRLTLDPAVVTSVMVESGGAEDARTAAVRAIDISPLDDELLDATLRLVRLSASPQDYPMLAPLVVREIVYRLLKGDQGPRLRLLATLGGQSHRMARAVTLLRRHYDKPLRIEDMAQELSMSVSGFHAHFKAVTAMSPLQFQKQIRLQEARRLMLNEDIDAAQAGFRVGYDDASHFNREYKRLFGEPPMQNVKRLRESIAAQATL